MSIIAENLTKVYGRQKALDGVSLTIEGNQVVGLIGPNGAGKSTLMKILTAYLPATEGTAVVNGYDVSVAPLEVKRTIGYLPEHNPLYTDMYVREYLRYVAGIYKISHAEARISEIIERTGLSPEVHKRIAALSKGYRQRVGIAQALLPAPKVLILDEPTSGLDPNQIAEIRALVAEVGRTSVVILSTHIMQEVEAVCNRVILLNKGKIVADDTTSNLKTKLSTGVHLVVKTDPILPAEVLSGILKCQITQADGLSLLHHADISKLRVALMQYCIDNHISILEIYEQKSNLEQVFKDMTSAN